MMMPQIRSDSRVIKIDKTCPTKYIANVASFYANYWHMRRGGGGIFWRAFFGV